jgi:carboxyl-terminal processing protease
MRKASVTFAVCAAAWSLFAATPVAQDAAPPKPSVSQGNPKVETGNQTLISERHTNGFKWVPLSPGKDDGRIARVTAAFLERGHYSQQPIDATISSNFYTRYLDTLDPMHFMFLQSDIAEFDKWKFSLGEMALKTGDTAPGTIIFNRYLQRMREQVRYLTNLIATEKFEFNGNERYTPNRREMPRPRDLAEARTMWRDRLRYEWLNELLNKKSPTQIKEDFLKRYDRQLDMFERWDSDDVLQVYLDSLAHAYDPHSDYMGKPASDNFNIGMRLSLFGIGALLRSEDGYCKIEELKEGPAKKSGQLKPNDKIIAVAQGTNPPVEVIDWKLNKVVDLIRGEKGTEVRLTVIPVDAADNSVRKVVSLIRAEIKLEDSEAKAKLLELPAEGGYSATRIGVISLPSFYADLKNRGPNRKSTTTDVAKLLTRLKAEKVSGVILDLRHNGGGSLEEAINLTGLFIKEGPVVQVKDSDGHITVDKDTDSDILYDGPLIVMTSRFSASASEILAGALQDYGRALIVGDASTHGKGTVQTLLDVGPLLRTKEELGSLKITIRKFYRASGSSTQRKGVVPDIILPSINNHAEVGEDSLPNALPWDTVPTARYEPVNVIPPVLPGLRQRSAARLEKDPDFAYIREDIERFKKARDEKSVSMNEAERWKEKRENEARAKERNKELRARPQPNYKTYDFTLKNVDEPNLPDPTTNTVAVTKKDEKGAVITTNLTAAKLTNELSKSTNSVAKTEEEEPPTPSIDPQLDETRRILRDLIAAVGKGRSGLAGKP